MVCKHSLVFTADKGDIVYNIEDFENYERFLAKELLSYDDTTLNKFKTNNTNLSEDAEYLFDIIKKVSNSQNVVHLADINIDTYASSLQELAFASYIYIGYDTLVINPQIFVKHSTHFNKLKVTYRELFYS